MVAGDDTTLCLPPTHSDTLRADKDGFGFGCYRTDMGVYSLARAALHQARTGLILFATLAADTQDERSMLTVQLDHLRPSDLMVLDSCYPSLLAVCTPAHQRKSPLHPPQA